MSNKKKLSILISSLGAGGAEKFVSTLLPFLVKDFAVDLVLFTDTRHFNIPTDVKVTVLTNNSRSFFFKIFNFFICIRKYHLFIKKNKIDISLSLLTRPNLINGVVAIFNPKVRTIISERCFPSIAYKSHKMRYRLYSVLFPLLYNKADALFSNSVYINKDLKENFGLKISAYVIYNGVNVNKDLLLIDNSSNFYERPKFEIVTAGSLYNPKNQQLLLQSVAKLKPGTYACTIVGDGVLMSYLKELSNTLNIKDITFTGRVNNIYGNLCGKHCFVLTSNTEGFPNVLLEAMSVGLPVISTDCMSGPLELLNNNEKIELKDGEYYKGKYGILVKVEDAVAIASAIELLRSDYQIWLHYSLMALERSKRYASEIIYQDVKTLINTNYLT
jgi:glycosyltransferase involved in cell wall biosynthesis